MLFKKENLSKAFLITALLLSQCFQCQAQDEIYSTVEIIRPKVSGNLVSLELYYADLRSVFTVLGEILQLNIVAHKNVNGRIKNIRLRDVPANQILEIILRMNNLYATRENNVIIVYRVKDYTDSS